jgi:TrmH family RNA methyltransferase
MEMLGKRGRRVKDLRRRVRSRPAGEVIVDGRRLVADLVRWKIPIRELYLTPEESEKPEMAPWISAATTVGLLDPQVLRDLAPTRHPQGVLAVVGEPFFEPWNAVAGTAVWLDGVQDPGNVGAVIRAAAGLGAAAVLLSPDCADPFGPVAVRGSAGAAFRLPVERTVDAAEAVALVRDGGGEIWAAGAGGRPVASWRPAEPCLLMVGSEGAGLSREALLHADGEVTIPIDLELDSLNLAVAVGILLQHLRR